MPAVNMKQYPCYLSLEQIAKLRKITAETGIPTTVLIRKGVDYILAQHAPKKRGGK